MGNDCHMEVAQGFLKQQFPGISGLQSSLQQKNEQAKADCQQQIQLQYSSLHFIHGSSPDQIFHVGPARLAQCMQKV